MAKKKGKKSKSKSSKKLTKNQQEWKHQLELLKRRARDWEKKFHAKIESFPEMPKTVRQKDIQNLKDIRWNKITEEQKQQLQQNYQEDYDEKDETEAEDDYFNDDYGWVDEPLDSDEEIEQYIDDMITEIAFGEDIPNETPGVADTLYNLLESARQRMGDRDFKQFLEEHSGELNTAARNAKSGSPGRSKRGGDRFGYTGMSNDQRESLNEFATILNMGEALSQEQSMTLNTEGYVNFDYSERL